MRLILALGAAAAAMTVAAYAQPRDHREEHRQMVIAHGPGDMDADHDGWITRAESSAVADRIFAELDRNHDGRLNEADHPAGEPFELRHGDHVAPGAAGDNCDRTESTENGQRRVTVICREEHGESHASTDDSHQRHEERRVIIHSNGDDEDGDVLIAPVPPVPPLPPHPPMFMMMFGDDSEADLNNDGAISQDEFRAQHLRMFDAHDANGDGRIRAPRMPDPPEPPAPPTPPSPPRRG